MAKNTAAQMELRNLTPVVPAQWENWATAEIKTGNLKGACWKDSKWQASLKKVVVSIERQFNEAVASVDDAFFVADYLETISWLGGVRVYEEVTRLSRDAAEAIPVEGAVRPFRCCGLAPILTRFLASAEGPESTVQALVGPRPPRWNCARREPAAPHRERR